MHDFVADLQWNGGNGDVVVVGATRPRGAGGLLRVAWANIHCLALADVLQEAGDEGLAAVWSTETNWPCGAAPGTGQFGRGTCGAHSCTL